MGIKGIYGEIGPGERIALSKLAIDKFEETGRPLRIAIDISIWQFQIQAGQGGSNPAIRTFYYRLLRLLSVSVQPLFVFDGPNKPPFKRNKRTGHHGASIPNMMCKQLLKLFGFPFHIAPGEAEAECAYLQREGIVDAVLSEDVDTLMFGCGITLRNWSAEAARGDKSPTHVSVYDAKATKEGKAGLDREGMVLVALMSGGDYITEGIPGCGIKVACEAARAGFGKSLCKVLRADTAGLDAWRKNLAYELQTNESKYFRCKHKSLTIPDNFPNKEVLGYYTHPIVSTAAKIERLRDEITWDCKVDIPGLRLFVAEAFDWTNMVGAKKFIRGLAPVLLVQKLRLRGDRRSSGYGDVVLIAMQEMELVRAICGKRVHFSTDGTPEMRVIYHPNDIVGLDLDAEHDDSEDYGRDGLAPLNDDDQIEAYVSEDGASRSPSKRAASVYDPTQPDKLWILETIVKVGIPLKAEDYEESLRNPRKFIKAKAIAKKAAAKGGMPKGAMEKFVKVSKPIRGDSSTISNPPHKALVTSCQPNLPPAFLAPTLERAAKSATTRSSRTRTSARTNREGTVPAPKAAAKTKTREKATAEKPPPNANPWSLAKSSPSTSDAPMVTKSLTRSKRPGIMNPFRKITPELSQSPPPMTATSNQAQKRAQSTQKENNYEELNSTPHHNASTLDNTPLTPTSDGKDHLKSPRKKRTPHSTPAPCFPAPYNNSATTPDPVNRKINFHSPVRERSSSPALPSLQNIFSQFSNSGGKEQEVISISSSPEAARPSRINTSPRRRPNSPENHRKGASREKARAGLDEDNDDGDEKENPGISAKKDEGKKYIMLRESLPGGWKAAGGNEAQLEKARRGGKAWRISQVEVLDLTEE